MPIFVLGIDLGKNVCSLVGLDKAGAVVLRRRLRRDVVVDFVGSLPACIVAMAAAAQTANEVPGSSLVVNSLIDLPSMQTDPDAPIVDAMHIALENMERGRSALGSANYFTDALRRVNET